MRTPTPKVVEYRGSKTSPWVVEGLRMHGKRVRRFFKSRRKAESFLRQTLVRLENEGVAALKVPEALRVEAVRCSTLLKPTGKTLTDAVEHYLAHLRTLERTCTVNELRDELLAAKLRDGASARYVEDLRKRTGYFAADFGERTVATITTQEVDDWLRALPVGPQTRNNCRTVLGTMFAFAVGRNYAPTNPVEKTAKAKVTRKPPGIFTPAELRALLLQADANFLPVLAIGAFAGLRPSEVARLDWSNVDFARGLIHLGSDQTKTSARRLVTIQPVLAAWLAPLAKPSGPVQTFAEEKTAQLRKATLKAAGVAKWPHDALRHSFASYHVAQFRNVNETAMQLGHQNAKMVYQHYREVVLPEAAAEWWQMMPPTEHSNVIAFRREAANA